MDRRNKVFGILWIILSHLTWTESLSGCIIFSEGANDNSTTALCDERIYNFTIIPQHLSSNTVKLTINNQMIKSLDSSQFSNIQFLVTLNLDANGIKSFHKGTFAKLKQLKSLSLQHNQLTLHVESFGSLSLLGLENLEYLDLRHNPLGFVPNYHFSSNTLKNLFLSSTASNFFISPNGFDKMYSLEFLDLSYSGLTTLPHELKNNFMKMNLKNLLLHENPWLCDCRIEWLKEWYDNLFLYRDSSLTKLNVSERPICQKPERLRGKYLIGSDQNSIKISDLKCSSEIFTQDSSINVIRGSNVTFICDCYSDPPTKVRWYKDNELINPYLDDRILVQQTHGKKFEANLTITSVMIQDEGVWQCLINDSDKQKTTKFSLGVYSGSESDVSTFYNRLVNMNSGMIIKYAGLSIACFILFVMLISLVIYCFYDKSTQKGADSNKTTASKYDSSPNYDQKNATILSQNEQDHGYIFDEYTQMASSIFSNGDSRNLTSQTVSPTNNENFMTLCPIGDQNFFLASPNGTQEANYSDMLTLRVLPTTTSAASNPQNLQHITFLPADLVFLNDSSDQGNDPCPLHGPLMATSSLQRNDKRYRNTEEGSIEPKSLKPLSSTAV